MKTTMFALAFSMLGLVAAGCGTNESPTEPAPMCRDGFGYGLVMLDSCAAAPGCTVCVRESASGSRAPLNEPACAPPAAYGADVGSFGRRELIHSLDHELEKGAAKRAEVRSSETTSARGPKWLAASEFRPLIFFRPFLPRGRHGEGARRTSWPVP